MLIATFGPTTAWQGLRITWGDGAFMLEGQGAVTAADVMEYDRQGHLIWADEGTRAWVGSRAAGSKAVSAGSTPALAGDERHPRLSRAVVVAIIALLVLNLVLLLVVAGHTVHILP